MPLSPTWRLSPRSAKAKLRIPLCLSLPLTALPLTVGLFSLMPACSDAESTTKRAPIIAPDAVAQDGSLAPDAARTDAQVSDSSISDAHVDAADAARDSGSPPRRKPDADSGRGPDDGGTHDGSTHDGSTHDGGSDGGDAAAPLRCDALPEGPVSYTIVAGSRAAEDFAFDRGGRLWSVDSAGSITTTAHGEEPVLRIPGVASGFVSGTRLLANGNLIVNDSSAASVTRISPQGGKSVLATGLSYPNGLAIGMDGWAYVAEQSANRVVRIHPTTKALEVVGEGIDAANGLSFSPDYDTLYVGGFGTGVIKAIDVLADGEWGEPHVFADNIGGGSLDGMAVDACGNVYVCEYVAAVVWRISPDGLTKTPIVDLHTHTTWIPNMNWGSGFGWKRDVLYVSDRNADHLYAVEVGVPGKPEPQLQ